MQLQEQEQRAAIVELAHQWCRTPYRSGAMVRGAGTDCAMLLVAVYRTLGYLPPDFDPRPYSPQWHLHRNEEIYLNFARHFARELPAPSGPGDAVLFKIGRLFAHGGIITSWPNIIHARAPSPVYEEDCSRDVTGKHALWRAEKRFFTLWGAA
jgi:cell wall-associated NlpC family hydrolase